MYSKNSLPSSGGKSSNGNRSMGGVSDAVDVVDVELTEDPGEALKGGSGNVLAKIWGQVS